MLKKLVLMILLISSSFGYIIIEHKPVEYFIPNYRVIIEANMKEYYHNFTFAKLYFRPFSQDGKASFYQTDMRCDVRSCKGLVPAPLKSTISIDYYIEAFDTADSVYKTQIFSVPQVKIPSWQIDDRSPIELLSSNRVVERVSIEGFGEDVTVHHVVSSSDNSKKELSKFIPSEESVMKAPENQTVNLSQIKSVSDESVDFTGIWSIRRTLSTCHSGIYSHKVMKIDSFNGVITGTSTIGKGTRFYHHPKDGFLCQLVDDSGNASLNGQTAVHTYQSFFESLKSGLRGNDFVKLLDFSEDSIVFELHIGNKTMRTTYKREDSRLFLNGGR
jgi:hypothetical protein